MNFDKEGFNLHRCDRSIKCTRNKVKLQLTVSAQPYYFPQELFHVLVTIVYIPNSTKSKQSLELLTDHIQDLETQVPDALIMITGNFNRRNTTKALPSFQQYVMHATREEVH